MNYVTPTTGPRGSVHSVALTKLRQGGRRRGKWLFLVALAVGVVALGVWLFAL
jgi:hypothetical protein